MVEYVSFCSEKDVGTDASLSRFLVPHYDPQNTSVFNITRDLAPLRRKDTIDTVTTTSLSP